MKLLLDECIDRRLAREFVGQNIKTVRLADLKSLVPQIMEILPNLVKGQAVIVSE